MVVVVFVEVVLVVVGPWPFVVIVRVGRGGRGRGGGRGRVGGGVFLRGIVVVLYRLIDTSARMCPLISEKSAH